MADGYGGRSGNQRIRPHTGNLVWQLVTNQVGYMGNSAVFNGQLIVSKPADGGPSPDVATSSNGSAWTQRSIPGDYWDYLCDLAYYSGTYVITANNGKYFLQLMGLIGTLRNWFQGMSGSLMLMLLTVN